MNLDVCEKCTGYCIRRIDLQIIGDNNLIVEIFFMNDSKCCFNIKKDEIPSPWKRKNDRSVLYSLFNRKKTFLKKGLCYARKYFKKFSIEDIHSFFPFYGVNHLGCPYELEHNLFDWSKGGEK